MASPWLARTWMLQEISESSSRRTVQWISRLSEDTLGLRRRSIFMALDPTYRKPGPRRLSCAQTARAKASHSVTITVHSRSGAMCVLWCSNTAHDALSKSANPPSSVSRTPIYLGCQIWLVYNIFFPAFENSWLVINKFRFPFSISHYFFSRFPVFKVIIIVQEVYSELVEQRVYISAIWQLFLLT